MTVRLAMWSGPRNISTAMMRSFGNRPGTLVVDEPLYAYYLAATGLDHPARAEILASQPNRWQDVAAALTGPLPGTVGLYYQKQMAHHLLPEVGRAWLGELRHAYLIRDPARVVASYARVRGAPTLADLGYPQQVEIFRAHGGPVVDAADVLRDPAGVLRRLCAALDLGYDPAMLSWPPGRRDTDGVWAPHWYDAVVRSTGFEPWHKREVSLSEHDARVAEACRPAYDTLRALRIRP